MSSSEQAEDARPTSPLLSAIADLRELIPRLFEEQKLLLQNREPEASVIPSVAPVPPSPVPVPIPTPLRPTVATPEREREPEPTSVVRRPPARPAEPPTPADPPLPTPIEPAAGSGPGPIVRPDNPRQRLDALAKLLDKRLKPSPGTSGRTGDT